MVDWHELEESEKREFAQRELLGDQPSHVHSSLGRWLEELGAFCGQGCGATQSSSRFPDAAIQTVPW